MSWCIRHYWRNPCEFLIHRLLICLNSAGLLAWVHVLIGMCKAFDTHTHTHTHRIARRSTLFKYIKSIAYERHTDMLSIANVKGMTALTCRACKSSAWLCHDSSLMPGDKHWNRQAFRNTPKAQCAFKFLLIHESLLFSMLITLCCTLHHHPSQDIQC